MRFFIASWYKDIKLKNMKKYIDSHCHLPNSESFDTVFARANAMGVVGCVLNSVTENDWKQITQIANSNKNVIGAVGIHPWHVETASEHWIDNMSDILQDNPNITVGEVGLDKTHENFAAQEKIFIQSLEIAIKYRRVLNLHCVHAWDIMLQILKKYEQELPAIVAHAFDGTQNALDFGDKLYFSYSPNVGNPGYKKVISSVLNVPKNKILVESDSSELLPITDAVNGVLSLRDDITSDDIFNNAMGVFFNG